jgi:hypothetical protein
VGESLTRAGAGFAGGWGGAKIAGTVASPALAAGPKGWVLYGGALVAGGTVGALGGEALVAGYFESDPEDHLWVDATWIDDLPAPGPPSELR